MNKARRYPAKIMLVGEYGVLVGGEALTIPFPAYGATVRSVGHISAQPISSRSRGVEARIEHSQRNLKALCRHIAGIPPESFHAEPDVERLDALPKDYWLESDIPMGVGLGSSGAVSAAVYDLCFPDARGLSLHQQKEDLARIESHFHGRSSGVDALTCFVGRSLRFFPDGQVRAVDIPAIEGLSHQGALTRDSPEALARRIPCLRDSGASFSPAQSAYTHGISSLGYRFFLLDSGERSDTHSLVSRFLSEMEQPGFADQIRQEYLPLNRRLIEALLGEREDAPVILLAQLSDLQLRLFESMIPESVIDLWREGLSTDSLCLKLSGSGGGFVLGVVRGRVSPSLLKRHGGRVTWMD